MNQPQRIGAVGHGVVEFRDGSRCYMVGPSGIKHYYADNEVERHIAFLGARSTLGPLPAGIELRAIGPGIVALVVDDEEFSIWSDTVVSYLHARREATEHLSRRRPASPAKSKRQGKGK